MTPVTLIIIAIISFTFGFYIKGKMTKTFTPKRKEEMAETRKEAHEALSDRTEKRKQRILNLMDIESVHHAELKACGVEDVKAGVTPTNVGKLLGVSARTARKYLEELESENKVTQIGERGKDIYYTLKV